MTRRLRDAAIAVVVWLLFVAREFALVGRALSAERRAVARDAKRYSRQLRGRRGSVASAREHLNGLRKRARRAVG